MNLTFSIKSKKKYLTCLVSAPSLAPTSRRWRQLRAVSCRFVPKPLPGHRNECEEERKLGKDRAAMKKSFDKIIKPINPGKGKG